MKYLLSFLLTIMLGAFAQANVSENLCNRSWWPSTLPDVQSVLLNNQTFDLNQACDEDGYRVVHLALIQNADLDVIKALVAKGADLTAKNVAGENAVYLANQYTSQEVYQYVLEKATQMSVLTVALEDVLAEETARLRSHQAHRAMLSSQGNAKSHRQLPQVSENLRLLIKDLQNRIKDLERENGTFEERLAFDSVEYNVNELQKQINSNHQLLLYYGTLIAHYEMALKKQTLEAHNQSQKAEENVKYYEEYYSDYHPDTWHRNAPVGIYVSFDAGTVLKTMFELDNTSDGIPTNCDPFLAKSLFSLPLSHPNCMNYADRWVTPFETQVGLTAGVMLGYGFRPFPTDKVTLRIEGEYARRQIAGNTSHSSVLEAKDSEFAFTHQSFSDLNTNQYFFNVYADFPKLLSKAGSGLHNITPYVGFGIGNLDPNLQYTSFWYRHKSGDTLAEQGVNPDAAGTISSGDFMFEGDNSPATQFIFGADYTLTQRIKLGLRARAMQIHQDFTSSNHLWQNLRSHQSAVHPGGRAITHSSRIDDLDFFDVTMQLRIHLGKKK